MVNQWQQDKPIYLQLYQQVIARIIDGFIQEEEALPSVRKVAAEYQLNPLTVSKAYQMLQDEQIVEKQRGKGLFVLSGVKEKVLAKEREQFLTEQWPQVLTQINRLQLDVDTLFAAQASK